MSNYAKLHLISMPNFNMSKFVKSLFLDMKNFKNTVVNQLPKKHFLETDKGFILNKKKKSDWTNKSINVASLVKYLLNCHYIRNNLI